MAHGGHPPLQAPGRHLQQLRLHPGSDLQRRRRQQDDGFRGRQRRHAPRVPGLRRREAWAFIPPALIPSLQNLPGEDHNIYVDASPVVYKYDQNGDGGSSTGTTLCCCFSACAAGGAPTTPWTSPTPTIPSISGPSPESRGGYEELGQSWSEPQFGLVKDTGGTAKEVVGFFGAGYDNLNEDQRFGNTHTLQGTIADPEDSSEGNTSAGTTAGLGTRRPWPRGLRLFGRHLRQRRRGAESHQHGPSLEVHRAGKHRRSGTSAPDNQSNYLHYSMAGDVAPVDTDFDGFIDRLYIGDTGGQMWRISDYYESGTNQYDPQVNPDIHTWYGKVIFDANPAADCANKGRKIFYRPSVVLDNGYIGVYFGTGDRGIRRTRRWSTAFTPSTTRGSIPRKVPTSRTWWMSPPTSCKRIRKPPPKAVPPPAPLATASWID